MACRGRIAAPWKKNSAPNSARTSSTRSNLPIDTPPLKRSKSDSSPCSIISPRTFLPVGSYAKLYGHATRCGDLGGQGHGVAIPNLKPLRALLDRHHFVARRQNGHAGLPVNPDGCLPHCGQQPYLRRL